VKEVEMRKVTVSAIIMGLFATAAMGAAVYDKEAVDFGESLSRSVATDDLINGVSGAIEFGGFYPGLGTQMDVTDGIWGGSNWGAGSAILRDYASGNPPVPPGVPAVTLRYDFSPPADITEILVFASNPDGYNARSYQNYDVEYKLAGDPATYNLLEKVKCTEYGQWNGNTEFVEKTMTIIHDDASPFVLQNVEELRFKLYDTGQTTGGFVAPGEAVEGSGIQEIDVLPEPASLLLLGLGALFLRRRRA
jgi:hypothetical protein